jgi:hypothetical protein
MYKNENHSILETLKFDPKKNAVTDNNGEIVKFKDCCKVKKNITTKTIDCDTCPLADTIKVILEQNKRLTEANNKLTEKLLEKI